MFLLSAVGRTTLRATTTRAIADYNEAIRLDPNYGEAFYNRGCAHISKNEYDRAIADINAAIELNPQDADFFAARGYAHERRGDHERAVADCKTAIRLNPTLSLTVRCQTKSAARKNILDIDETPTALDEAKTMLKSH
jgi:tetratricopeptide (TPR) repeat protein